MSGSGGWHSGCQDARVREAMGDGGIFGPKESEGWGPRVRSETTILFMSESETPWGLGRVQAKSLREEVLGEGVA